VSVPDDPRMLTCPVAGAGRRRCGRRARATAQPAARGCAAETTAHRSGSRP